MSNIKKIIFGIVLMISIASVLGAPGGDYTLSKRINITEQAGVNLTDYQVEFRLDTETLIANGEMGSDCNPLFYDSDDTTILPFYVEACDSSNTLFYIKVPTLTASTERDIYMYYGDTSTATTSNQAHTFFYVDTFDTGTNAENWTHAPEILGDAMFLPFGSFSYTNKWVADNLPGNNTQNLKVEYDLNNSNVIASGGSTYFHFSLNSTGSITTQIYVNYPQQSGADYGIYPTGASSNATVWGGYPKNTWGHVTVSWYNDTSNTHINSTWSNSTDSVIRTTSPALMYRPGNWTFGDAGDANRQYTIDNFTVRQRIEPMPTSELMGSSITITVNQPANTTIYDSDFTLNITLTPSSNISSANCYYNGTLLGVVNDTFQSSYYGGIGLNYANLTCINGTTSGKTLHYFEIQGIERTSYNNSIVEKETSNLTYGIGLNINTDVSFTNLTCRYDFNNTFIGSLINTTATNPKNFTGTRISPLTITNNTQYGINYNCTIPFYNGSTSYINYTTTQNLTYAYITLTSIVSEKTNATVGENITYTINSVENAIWANTQYYVNWNGTDATVHTGAGNSHYFDYTMPDINGFNSTVDVSAFLNVSSGGLKRNLTTEAISQVIYKTSFVNCSTGLHSYTFMTFGWYDEYNRTLLDFNTTQSATAEMDFDIYSPNGSTTDSTFNIITNSSTFNICIYPYWATFTYDLDMTYYSTDYNTRQYYLRSQTANNETTETLELYNLPEDGVRSGEKISLILIDEDDDYVTDAIFNFLRFYPDEDGGAGTEKYVAMAKTDELGKAFTYIEYNSALYRIIVTKGDEILLSIPKQLYNSDLIGTEITYNTRVSADMEFFSVIDSDNIFASLSINSTDIITMQLIDLTATTMASGYIKVENITRTDNIEVCESAETGTNSVVFYCNLGNRTGNLYHVYATVTSSTGETYTIYNDYLDYRTIDDTLGDLGLLYAGLLIMTFGTGGIIFGPAGVIIGIMSSIVLTNALGLMILDYGILIMIEAFLAVMLFILMRKG